jgi:WD40 repeat protein
MIFSRDGQRLAVLSMPSRSSLRKTLQPEDWFSGEIRVFNLSAQTNPRTRLVRGPFRMKLAFSLDGTKLAWGGNQDVRVWDLSGQGEPSLLRGHLYNTYAVAFSPDGRRLASAGEDCSIKVWDLQTNREEFTLRGHTGFVSGVAFSPDARKLASASSDKTVRFWDATTGPEVRTWYGPGDLVASMCTGIRPDGQRFAVWIPSPRPQAINALGKLVVWDVSSERAVYTLGVSPKLSLTAFNPAWKRMATLLGGRGKATALAIFDVKTGHQIRAVPVSTESAMGMAYSPDGGRIAVASTPRPGQLELQIFDQGTGRRLVASTSSFTASGEAAAVVCRAMCFSPDGKRFAVALTRVARGRPRKGVKAIVAVCDTATGKATAWLSTPLDVLNALAFSPDGQQLVAGGGDVTGREGTILAWSTKTWRLDQTLRGHTKAVSCLAFTPDGSRLATGSGDGTVKIWDPASAQDLLTLTGRTRWINQVAFSAHGHRLFSATGVDFMQSADLNPADYLKPVEFKIWDATPLPSKRQTADGKK